MAEAAALKKLEDQLNCLVCLDTYTDPKQLQCHHVYCQTCLVRLVVRDQQGQHVLTCPTCRQVTPVPASGVAGLQPAFHINHLLDILEEHKKAKEGALYCADHQERELELYCGTCEKLVCVQCTIKEHNGHKYNLLKDVLEQSKREIKASLTPAEEQLTAVSKALERVDTRKRNILFQQATVEAKVDEDSQRLVETIKARRNEHISKLHHITEEKLEALASQREQMETIKTQLSSYLDMVGETLTTGGQREVMNMKTTIDKQVKELTASFQTDTLEPIAQADVEFSTANKAVEVCQNYGQLGALGSPDPSKCRATGKSLEVATVGERSTAVLQVINFKGQPCEEPIKSSECELVSEITGTRARGSIERRGQSQYEISYQPTIKGRHQLHIKVEGQHISASPFCVAVKSPVEKLGTPIMCMDVFRYPWGVVINQRGEVVVTQQLADIIVFGPGGTKPRSVHTHLRKCARGVAIDGEGNILTVDRDSHCVLKYTTEGKFLAAVGGKNITPRQFFYPTGIAFNATNNKIYVADGNHRVQILNSDLTLSSSFGKEGSNKRQFKSPTYVACDSSGNVYVTDSCNSRIQIFTAEGKFLRMFGRHGEGKGELKWPSGIAIDANGMIYVSEGENHRVSVFTFYGQFVTSFGSRGEDPGQFLHPRGLAVDNSGVVYVCDWMNNRVQLF